LKHFSLFTGIGGIDLAAEWAGFESVGQCELADYPTKVLEKHWPNVPRWRDIRDVTAESVRAAGIEKINLLSGGFPCQPFSVAGKQRGRADDRDLWPEMFRVIQELKPDWVLGENVAGFVNMELERTIIDLESEGYEVQAFIIPACAVNAPHQRKRCFIVGNTKHYGLPAFQKFRSNEATSNERCKEESEQAGEFKGASRPVDEFGLYRGEFGGQQYSRETMVGGNRKTDENVAYSSVERLSGPGELIEPIYSKEIGDRQTSKPLDVCIGNLWSIEPSVGRVANGVPGRMDRLKCLGNAVVPQQVYPILKCIADIESRKGDRQ